LKNNMSIANKYQLPAVLFAKLLYSVEHEMIATPIDFLNRRTGAILFDIQTVKEWKKQVIAYLADRFNWSGQEKNKFSSSVEEALKAAVIPVDQTNSYQKAANGN
jgi:glycerol-3-phosphate dehydrogenase